jgi:hypothetical protein
MFWQSMVIKDFRNDYEMKIFLILCNKIEFYDWTTSIVFKSKFSPEEAEEYMQEEEELNKKENFVLNLQIFYYKSIQLMLFSLSF